MSEGIWVPPGGSADPPREQPESAPPSEPSPEELIQEFQRIKVSDLLVSTVYTLSQIGYGKLDPKTRDLEQAKLAIDALRAIMPLLEGTADPNLVRDFGQVVANMQLAYADAVGEAEPKRPTEEPEQPKPADEDLEQVDEEELGGGG
jgi:hypothetical protein